MSFQLKKTQFNTGSSSPYSMAMPLIGITAEKVFLLENVLARVSPVPVSISVRRPFPPEEELFSKVYKAIGTIGWMMILHFTSREAIEEFTGNEMVKVEIKLWLENLDQRNILTLDEKGIDELTKNVEAIRGKATPWEV